MEEDDVMDKQRKKDDAKPPQRSEGMEDLERIPDPDIVPGNGDIRPVPGAGEDAFVSTEGEVPGDLPGEDEDNPYQNSDEALPDDEEERRLGRNPSREGGLFDEY
jgi:hypothetical protein